MPVVYPSIECGEAKTILSKMRRLKSKRYNHDISRMLFLAQWEVLRKLLNDTEEYKALRRLVYARAKGICEKCKESVGNQMCHKIAVVNRPDLALRPDNVYLGCSPCHQLDHPDLQLAK